ncbi:hypothetical protein SCUP515_12417 [Seiridium cupressi]
MTTVLGKRKSRSAAVEGKPGVSEEEAREIFRRHFEAQFAPLPETTRQANGADSEGEGDGIEDLRSSSEDEDDEWDGLSETDETPGASSIEVVDYTKSNTATDPLAAAIAKREAKLYLSSKVPLPASATAAAATTKPKTKTPTEEDSTDLLRNDLALQRLLSESHLFNPSKHSSSLIGSAVTTEHSGRNRHLATDLRLAALGSKTSIYKQEKMPMSHRKGIEGAKLARESRRRKEAKENGIILEKEAKKKAQGGGAGRREKAVDAPAVGKMRNGMLRLSKQDIAEIQGPVRGGGKTKKRRR